MIRAISPRPLKLAKVTKWTNDARKAATRNKMQVHTSYELYELRVLQLASRTVINVAILGHRVTISLPFLADFLILRQFLLNNVYIQITFII